MYAVVLPHWVRFLLATRRFCPVVKRHGANVYADAIASADIPVYRNILAMYAIFVWGFYWSPDFVTVMFAYNFSVGLKIRVYRQKLSPSLVQVKLKILGFLFYGIIKGYLKVLKQFQSKMDMVKKDPCNFSAAFYIMKKVD